MHNLKESIFQTFEKLVLKFARLYTRKIGLRTPWIASRPNLAIQTLYSHRINELLQKRFSGQVVSYLEIGLSEGNTFQGVKAQRRTGVDPNPNFKFVRKPQDCKVIKSTSSEFFSSNEEKFDFIFIDGSHVFEDVLRDILDAISILSPGGLILVDDVIPCDSYSAMPDLKFALQSKFVETGSLNPAWHGDCFKAIFLLRKSFAEFPLQTLIPNFQSLIYWTPTLEERAKLIESDLHSLIRNYTDIDFSTFFADHVLLQNIFNFKWEWEIGISQK